MKKIVLAALLLLAAMMFIFPAAASEDSNIQTVYVSGFGSDTAAGTKDAPVKSLYAAFRALPVGGRVVIMDTLTVPATELPASDGLITITSLTEEEDYRVSGNAHLYLAGNLNMASAFKIENVNIVTTKKNLVIMCNGNYACFGEGITTKAGTSEVNLPSIAAGRSGATPADGTYLEIHSGDWFRVRGGSRGTSSATQTGDIYIIIRGGSFESTFDVGGDSATDGNANLYIYGGDFKASVNGASAADISGNLYISIYGGTFTSTINVSRGGNIGGDVTLNICTSIDKTIANKKGVIGGTVTAKTEYGINAKFSNITSTVMTASDKAAIEKADTLAIENAADDKLPDALYNPILDRDTTAAGTVSKTALALANACGDTNGDGRVSLSDVLGAVKLISAGYNADADVNGDGKITVYDAVCLLDATFNGERAILRGNTENRISDTLSLYGEAKVKGGKINGGFAFGSVNDTAYTLYSDIELGKEAVVGLYFGCNSTSPSNLSGYYFEADTVNKTLTLYRTASGIYRVVAQKNLDLLGDEARIRVTYIDGAAELYFEDNQLTPTSFFDFDLALEAMGNGVGLYVKNATASLPVCTLESAKSTDNTYKNHILTQFTDPEIFYENGKYYLLGTRSETQNQGVQCFSTTDFVNFTDEGFVLKNGDAFGDGVYKAANIVKYGDYYYLFYMAKSNELGTSVTAYASSTSVTGPFTNPDKTALTGDSNFIGGQPFVDDDGSVYLIYARTTGGNRIYGAKIKLSGGKATIDLGSEVLLLEPTEPWENAKASVVECGFIVKHGGVYYLLYSGGNYNSTYGTGYATAQKPLGPYAKYEHNPILVSNDQSYGVGAASPFVSPDGSEHFIIYLRNYSPTVVRPLQTCIDRVRFVQNPNGDADILEICGPTVNPQALPSGMSAPTLVDYQLARFHW